MSLEIERKFLVNQAIWKTIAKPTPYNIQQGYLCYDNSKTIRIRLKDSEAFITIKGKTSGFSRDEFEYPIPFDDAVSILKTMTTNVVEKLRFNINYDGNVWEVDVFSGENEGLILAEIELVSENQTFKIPDWIGEEVTSDHRYYNAFLAQVPYKTWSK